MCNHLADLQKCVLGNEDNQYLCHCLTHMLYPRQHVNHLTEDRKNLIEVMVSRKGACPKTLSVGEKRRSRYPVSKCWQRISDRNCWKGKLDRKSPQESDSQITMSCHLRYELTVASSPSPDSRDGGNLVNSCHFIKSKSEVTMSWCSNITILILPVRIKRIWTNVIQRAGKGRALKHCH